MSYKYKTKRSIIIQTAFEGIHYYVCAPDEVAFLRFPHRHQFNVQVKIEVFHDDRELEFFVVKKDLDYFLGAWLAEELNKEDVNCGSCEQIAQRILDYLKVRWPIPEEVMPKDVRCLMHRDIEVYVGEDGENASLVEYTRRFIEE